MTTAELKAHEVKNAYELALMEAMDRLAGDDRIPAELRREALQSLAARMASVAADATAANANARLIPASPDLLSASRLALAMLKDGPSATKGRRGNAMHALAAAIAKAEGR